MGNCLYCKRLRDCLSDGVLVNVTMSDETIQFMLGVEQQCPKDNKEDN